MVEIQTDFDRIALLPEKEWDHNTHYHDYLLRHAPPNMREALEIGCGTGTFSRALARRADHVTALDLSPQMVRIARERSSAYPNIEYVIADATEWDFRRRKYDCVASIATLHHMPMEPVLAKMRDALKSGGVLLVLDLYKQERPLELISSGPAMLTSMVLRLMHGESLRPSREERIAWSQHGAHDKYLTLAQVRRICRRLLPRASVRMHLLWRYSVVWRA